MFSSPRLQHHQRSSQRNALLFPLCPRKGVLTRWNNKLLREGTKFYARQGKLSLRKYSDFYACTDHFLSGPDDPAQEMVSLRIWLGLNTPCIAIFGFVACRDDFPSHKRQVNRIRPIISLTITQKPAHQPPLASNFDHLFANLPLMITLMATCTGCPRSHGS